MRNLVLSMGLNEDSLKWTSCHRKCSWNLFFHSNSCIFIQILAEWNADAEIPIVRGFRRKSDLAPGAQTQRRSWDGPHWDQGGMISHPGTIPQISFIHISKIYTKIMLLQYHANRNLNYQTFIGVIQESRFDIACWNLIAILYYIFKISFIIIIILHYYVNRTDSLYICIQPSSSSLVDGSWLIYSCSFKTCVSHTFLVVPSGICTEINSFQHCMTLLMFNLSSF